ATAVAMMLQGTAEASCSTPKVTNNTAWLTATETTDTSVYRTAFLPVGVAAQAFMSLGARLTPFIISSQSLPVPRIRPRKRTSRWIKGVCPGHCPKPRRARLGLAFEGRAVDGHEPEGGSIAEGPLEVVESAPVRVPAHVDAVVEAPAGPR